MAVLEQILVVRAQNGVAQRNRSGENMIQAITGRQVESGELPSATQRM